MSSTRLSLLDAFEKVDIWRVPTRQGGHFAAGFVAAEFHEEVARPPAVLVHHHQAAEPMMERVSARSRIRAGIEVLGGMTPPRAPVCTA